MAVADAESAAQSRVMWAGNGTPHLLSIQINLARGTGYEGGGDEMPDIDVAGRQWISRYLQEPLSV